MDAGRVRSGVARGTVDRGSHADVRFPASRLPAERTLCRAHRPDRWEPSAAVASGDYARDRDYSEFAAMNLFTPSRFVENVTRLALGIEPVDGVLAGLIGHPVEVLFPETLR